MRSVRSIASQTSFNCCGEDHRPFWTEDGRYLGICLQCGTKFTYEGVACHIGKPWIGVDLDGTLARDLEDPDKIGEPLDSMMNRVRDWIAQGKIVKIFTARASIPRQVLQIKQWLKQHGLPDLEVTNEKDFYMVELWDDRAVQVVRNSGQPLKNQPARNAPEMPGLKIVARRKEWGKLVSKIRLFFAS